MILLKQTALHLINRPTEISRTLILQKYVFQKRIYGRASEVSAPGKLLPYTKHGDEQHDALHFTNSAQRRRNTVSVGVVVSKGRRECTI
jgi:hypothetical protein